MAQLQLRLPIARLGVPQADYRIKHPALHGTIASSMAEILPFRALRYNPAHVEVAKAVTQPYDKITPAMQATAAAAASCKGR